MSFQNKLKSITKLFAKQQGDTFIVIEPQSNCILLETVNFQFAKDWIEGFLVYLASRLHGIHHDIDNPNIAHYLGTLYADRLSKSNKDC